MRDDELQVLGSEKKRHKYNKVAIAIIALVAMAIGAGLYWALSSQQPEKIKTGKKIGDPTIVPRLQTVVDSLLNAKMTEIGNCLQGQVIVMEVQTGEILAMVGQERNYEGKFQPCKNFAHQQELGSLTKTASLLAVLETGKMKLNSLVDVGNGLYQVDDEGWMKDHNWRRGGYGMITLDRALEISSNIGIGKAVNIAFGSNQQAFFDQLEKMSLGQPDYIEGIEGLKPNSYSSPKDPDWISRRIWWSAIGYERMIAPIQMLTFYNAIANDGEMVKPTLKTGEKEIINPQIASEANIDSMQVVLKNVVSRGLGKRAGTPIVGVAGKPATSQVGDYEFGEENYVEEYQVAFCGYFPAEAPKYSMIVSMNKLGLPASGGGQAGALFHDIVEWMITHDMLTVLMEDEETNDSIKTSKEVLDSIKSTMK